MAGRGRRSRHAVLGHVFNGNGSGNGGILRLLHGNTKLELRLGLGGTVKLLVDRGVGGVEKNIGGGRVRVALQVDIGVYRNVQNAPNLE